MHKASCHAGISSLSRSDLCFYINRHILLHLDEVLDLAKNLWAILVVFVSNLAVAWASPVFRVLGVSDIGLRNRPHTISYPYIVLYWWPCSPDLIF